MNIFVESLFLVGVVVELGKQGAGRGTEIYGFFPVSDIENRSKSSSNEKNVRTKIPFLASSFSIAAVPLVAPSSTP